MSTSLHLLLVSYSTKLLPPETLSKLEPEFKPNGTTKEETKVAAQIAEKRTKWQTETAKVQPYTAALSEVYLGSPKTELGKFVSGELSAQMSTKGMTSDSPIPPIEVQISSWLSRKYPRAWSKSLTYSEGDAEDAAPVLFVGFNPSGFLNIVGVECAKAGKPAAYGLWSGQAACRDITSLIGRSSVDFAAACVELGLTFIPPGWEPHVDAKLDMQILLALTAKLHLLDPAAITATVPQELAAATTDE